MEIFVKTRKEGAAAVVEIDRPDALNALNLAVLDELTAVFLRIREDDSYRGVILTGSGNRSFVAGADISEMKTMGPNEARDFSRRGHELARLIETFPKPVIAAVNGFALGGGNELAMAAHIRIASDNAKFGQPESGLGLIPGFGGTQRLPRIVGMSRALSLNLTGEVIKADRALAIGLVDDVVSQEELLPRCLAVMETIFSKSPVATRLILEAMERGRDMPLADALSMEKDLFTQCFTHEDKDEGTTAFMEKRKPIFSGR